MRLEVSVEPGRELRRAAHHFFRTGNGETWTERVLEPSLVGAMPFPAKAFALEQRNGEHLFGLELTVRAKVHHHFPENRANAAFLRGLEPDVATVFVNCGIRHHRRGPIAHQLAK